MLLVAVALLGACLVDGFNINHVEDKNWEGSAPSGDIAVHVVPHTHDDVGWLKTVDQYYYGSRDEIYKGGVQYILDTVITELSADPNKTFIYVEMAFFARWWEEQGEAMRATVRDLVKRKQLEFISAGWCMNDEASVHYTATIDQMSEGMRWLQKEVGTEEVQVAPTIAWQIDPFGHSLAQADLSAQMGMKGMFFARMHYQDYDKRMANKDMEFQWNVNNDQSLFTSAMYRGRYNAPPGFDFDRRAAVAPMVRDTGSPEYNIPERVGEIVTYLEAQAAHYRSGNILLTMGGDFCYQNAHKYFKNLDILIEYVNANKTNGFNMVYSTPSRYMDAVLAGIGEMQEKTDDLFPYANDAHSYWTGYFTSRPTLKGYVRDCNNVLQTCKQVEAAVGIKIKARSSTLRQAMGVAQHHDAVSGTSKQHVADDYSRRLAKGQTECEEVITSGVAHLGGFLKGLQSCRLLNESVCEVTEDGNNSLTVAVYNPRMLARAEYIRIPLQHPHYTVRDLTTRERVPIEFIRTSPATADLNPAAAPLEGLFRAQLPPVGFSSYQLELDYTSRTVRRGARVYSGRDLIVESDIYRIRFDPKTGAMLRITNKLAGMSGASDALTQRFMQYSSSTGNKASKQASGAYIFRPKGETPDDLGDPVLTNYIPGDFVTEIWQSFGDWISQVTRVYKDKFYIEVEWTVGPIPADHGREIITRYETSLVSNGTFYTDSNGRQTMKRVLNQQPTWEVNVTEPVAGNYYPVNTRAALVDQARGMQLSVLTDRSQGAASLSDGQLEFMVHRRLQVDDHRGVVEPLNETADGRGLIARGKHWLFYSDLVSEHLHRSLAQDLFYKPVLAIAVDDEPAVPQWSFMGSKIGGQFLNLVTVQAETESSILVRLESVLPASEGGKANLQADLSKLFVGKEMVKFEELALGGDRPVAEVVDYAKHTSLDTANTITLKPFQIRTFLIHYKHGNDTEI